MVFNDFLGFDLPKNKYKPCHSVNEKNMAKKTLQSQFWRPFSLRKASQNCLKIEPGRKKIGSQTTCVSRRYVTRARVVGSQRASAFVKRPKGYAYD